MNPYELSTHDLLNAFMNACGRAGTSNSGLVISFSAADDLRDAHYLKGAILARINHVTPPVKVGDKLRPNKEGVIPSANNGWEHRGGPRKLPQVLTVKKIYYRGEGAWQYLFDEEVKNVTAWEDGEYDQDGSRSWLVPLRFDAEDFDLVEKPVLISA